MATRYKGTEKEERALNTFIKLSRAMNSVSGRIAESVRAFGLTESQFGVLEALYHIGPMCLSDLGKKILKSEANMTTIVDNLERDGLVRRERSKEDRRYVLAHLTSDGREKLGAMFPDHVSLITELFNCLDSNQQDQLSALCRTVGLAAAQK